MFDISQEAEEEQMILPWLIFRVGEEYYAINTQYAVYIMQLPDDIVTVPEMEYTSYGLMPYMDGYLQLTSLRMIFGVPMEPMMYEDDNEASRSEMVIVVQEGDISRGIVVDEVLSIEEILPVEGEVDAGQAVQKSACISGAGRTASNSERIILLVDAYQLLARC